MRNLLAKVHMWFRICIVSAIVSFSCCGIVMSDEENSSASCSLIAQPESQTDYLPKKHTVDGMNVFSLATALTMIQDDTVLCLTEGEYPPIKIKGYKSKGQGLVIKPFNNQTEVVIKTTNLFQGASVDIVNSDKITVDGLITTGGMYGIHVVDSSNIVISNNTIYYLGQEGIQVSQKWQNINNIRIVNNTIRDTGNKVGQYGEGIYIGNGSHKSKYFVTDVVIESNVISDTLAEAIDVKTNSSQVSILNNEIFDVNLKFNGAITVGTEAQSYGNGNYQILGNTISNISNRLGYNALAIAVGHGNTIIKENKILLNEKKSIGICLMTTFSNDNFKTVKLKSNVIRGIGRKLSTKCGDGGTKLRKYADVRKI